MKTLENVIHREWGVPRKSILSELLLIIKIGTKLKLRHRPFISWLSYLHNLRIIGPRSAVGNVSGNRCESDCRSRGREFDPCPVPYFRGD